MGMSNSSSDEGAGPEMFKPAMPFGYLIPFRVPIEFEGRGLGPKGLFFKEAHPEMSAL